MANNDLAAIQLLKEWITWLMAIETAAIGGLAISAKDIEFADDIAGTATLTAATLVIVCFGVAVVLAMVLLLKLPAVVQRLPPPEGRDVYAMRAMDSDMFDLSTWVTGIRRLSIVGFGALAAVVVLTIWFGSAPD